ncbi:hypothetical protein BAE44_0023408 [Dichanthelium oligosanthes]|uniref:Biogenesis of lysosome-related organelles complex 1 subunit 1 n=1 Tax=Dichanthelium oligosanthes TaxID=888268 RepID=A0A1E5URR6_9POAL|nr:hypothetical protein BAE44_0023408 [Dichanthelium oligosanthes]
MDGAKTAAAGGKQGLEEALLQIVQQHHRQSLRQRQQTAADMISFQEIGDFENWMKIMDFDCKSINAAIRNIHQS